LSPRSPAVGIHLALLLGCIGAVPPAHAVTVPFAYVSNKHSNNVSVINTATKQVAAWINVGEDPSGVAASPDSHFVYVANGSGHSNSVSVIDTRTNQVVATVPVGDNPTGIGITLVDVPGCAGDCNEDGVVTIDEPLTGINIALGDEPLTDCPRFDVNGDGEVTVDDLLAAVEVALNGCSGP
jgi:YVTN family beta-propeller protein